MGVIPLALLLLSLTLAACGKSPQESSEPGSAKDPGNAASSRDSSAQGSNANQSAEQGDRLGDLPFEQRVLSDYAGRAVADLPKSVRDSIVKLRDPKKFMKATQEIVALHEHQAKEDVARKYSITVDSLESIIKRGSGK